MDNHHYYEYYDSEKKKFIFLTLYIDEKENLFKKDFYHEIINYIENNFLYTGNMHTKIYKDIEVYTPSYFTDKKIKLYNISKEVQENINNFLSITISLDKRITNYYILENLKKNIIITNKYKLDGIQYKNHFQCYSEKNYKYYPNGISYILEEHNYRPTHYFIYSIIKRIIYFYFIVILFFIMFVFYYII
tara:strand:- start:789 stop:1358 length:570 start_codon:yes stop_codon:yes gene_type:complete